MDKRKAISYVNDQIESYKLQRNINVYNNMGISYLEDAFRVNCTNIALLPNPILVTGAALALITGTIYLNELNSHPLTRKISRLKHLKDEIVTTNLVTDMTIDELSEVAHTKTYMSK